jgi:integrase
LAKYLAEKDALHSGKRPRADAEGATVNDLANLFLNAKQALMDLGELSPLTWNDYKRTAELLVKQFGKQRVAADLGPDDFGELRNKMARRWGSHHLTKTIQCIRCLFKHAYEAGAIDRPMRYGPDFKRPSKKTMRLHRARQGAKLFTAEEVRNLLAAAGTHMKAIILLGINCGFGNSDVGNLPLSALDLAGGWVDYPRPKTGIARRCALWPETVQVIREALARRPAPKDAADAGLAFITKYGGAWAKDIPDSPVTKETRKLRDALGMNGHRTFYTLRHTFRTVVDEAKDQPAVDLIMGHESTHMAKVYRERIADARLRAVAEHVRGWLFAPSEV